MPLGRPRSPGTEERAAARRDKVRLIVKAFRRRQRQKRENTVSSTNSAQGEPSTQGEPIATNTAPSEDESTRRQLALRGSSAVSLTTDSPHLLAEGAWSLQLPMRIDCGPAYQDAFIAALQY